MGKVAGAQRFDGQNWYKQHIANGHEKPLMSRTRRSQCAMLNRH